MQQNCWKLLYEDKDILVVCKAPGLATQSGKFGAMDLINSLRNYRNEKEENPEVFLIHRLDQPVGGILVFGKTKKAAANLSEQVQKHTMEKYYKAVVQGEIEEKGRLEDYLLQDRKTSRARVVEKGTADGKKAVLEFQRLAICNTGKDATSCSLVEVKLETGRFHQIRVQMANHGYPICSDSKYNGNCNMGSSAELCKPDKIAAGKFPALFAWKLVFNHPVTGKQMEFKENPEYGYFSLFE